MSGRAAVWQSLQARAALAMRNAYAPYSGFAVGAAAFADDGRLVTGCNIENAAYGVGLCAECSMVSQLYSEGTGRRLEMVVCVGGPVGGGACAIVMPCGRCRQLLWEHGGEECRIMTPAGEQSLAEVLPQAFGRDSMADLGVTPGLSAEG